MSTESIKSDSRTTKPEKTEAEKSASLVACIRCGEIHPWDTMNDNGIDLVCDDCFLA